MTTTGAISATPIALRPARERQPTDTSHHSLDSSLRRRRARLARVRNLHARAVLIRAAVVAVDDPSDPAA